MCGVIFNVILEIADLLESSTAYRSVRICDSFSILMLLSVLDCVVFNLRRLQFVFQSPLISALDLIDRGNVTLLTSPSGRQVFRVSLIP